MVPYKKRSLHSLGAKLPYISDHKAAKCQKIHLKKAYNPYKASVAITIKIIGIFAIYFGTVEPAIFIFFIGRNQDDSIGVVCFVGVMCDNDVM